MNGPTFAYNNPRINGQTIFVKRGEHAGKLGIVKQVLENEKFLVSQADFGTEQVVLKRAEFLVYRYRKIRVPIDRVAGKNPDVL
ncbi:DUF3912 family protein [Idiomarina seosinensis]|uniref:KOW domain-containing protein n=1 Tax=Idiomarina seosinensis TaxID=281739 RepID=A0A432ZI02_9GAMM|nr:DUF3912 family protein [Idiomarina seosinensis]RUO77655.1 hypothetical protein CWI81_04035 [Idiomarina seosinensis]